MAAVWPAMGAFCMMRRNCKGEMAASLRGLGLQPLPPPVASFLGEKPPVSPAEEINPAFIIGKRGPPGKTGGGPAGHRQNTGRPPLKWEMKDNKGANKPIFYNMEKAYPVIFLPGYRCMCRRRRPAKAGAFSSGQGGPPERPF